MIPFVSPAPLSACTLVGFRKANPQPSTMSCSVAGASLPGAGGGGSESLRPRAGKRRPAERRLERAGPEHDHQRDGSLRVLGDDDGERDVHDD